MNIELWCIGKTAESYLTEGIAIYEKRLKHYCNFSLVILSDIKKFSTREDLKNKEGALVLSKLDKGDFFILLDERGRQFTSMEWASKIEQLQMMGKKRIILLIAGAFGASAELKTRADLKLSLSKMTFSHQMIRLFIVEQIYRGYSILRNEKYHNE